jgi:hypothetical protein
VKDLVQPPPEFLVREPVDPNDPVRMNLKRSIKTFDQKVRVDLLDDLSRIFKVL